MSHLCPRLTGLIDQRSECAMGAAREYCRFTLLQSLCYINIRRCNKMYIITVSVLRCYTNIRRCNKGVL